MKMQAANSIVQTIERRIRKQEERIYDVEVPFAMPDQVEELRVAISVQALGEGQTTIDLGLKSPSRVRGWSGGARKAFFVGEEKATPGYMPGELLPGQWAVLLGAYRVPDAGCRVTIDLEFRLAASRWLKGDLHTHSVHSDGAYTLEETGSIVESLGLDFIATTDHNTVSQNFLHPQRMAPVFIPGMEWTTRQGHANFLGVRDPLPDFRARHESDMAHHLRTASENGATVILNHTHCDHCPWKWTFDVPYDAVEVWNGPWTERNERALQWWQEQLAMGRRIAAVGGSDTHRPHPYVKHAMPTTWVYAAKRTVRGILQAIEQGRVFISFAPDGPVIEHHIGDAMIGDTACWEAERGNTGDPVFSKLKIARLAPGDRINIVSEQGVEEQFSIQEQTEITYSWQIKRRLFYRVEVWRYFAEAGKMLIAALSNPIYIR